MLVIVIFILFSSYFTDFFCSFFTDEQIDFATDPRCADINNLTGLLKFFFRELPEPLFTYDLYDQFLDSSRLPDLDERIAALRRTVQLLPPSHLAVLKYMTAHLLRVASLASVNRMEISNLSIVFGPTLLRARTENFMNIGVQNGVVEQILTHHARIMMP